MNRPGVLRILFFSLILVLFGYSREFASAGVHGGGGGGFHGGGGGFHAGGYGGWHGGGYGGWHGGGYGGWHGGGYGGWHGGGYGGWYGWRGGYYGGWGWPWGFGISFNFGWPYYYGYPYAYPYPYYYPSYPYSSYPPGYNAPSNAPSGYSDSAPPTQAGGNIPSAAPQRQPVAPTNTVTLQETVSRHAAANYGTAPATAAVVSYRPPSAERQLPPMRPQVQNVIRALRAMPPEARQQQIDSGRYSNLSPQELKLVQEAADLPSRSF